MTDLHISDLFDKRIKYDHNSNKIGAAKMKCTDASMMLCDQCITWQHEGILEREKKKARMLVIMQGLAGYIRIRVQAKKIDTMEMRN